MEQEKLNEAEKTFKEDKEKFETYLEELTSKANQAAEEV